jgi:hypothetical protein
VAASILCVGAGAFAQSNQPLEVGFDAEGCPTEVISKDNSCGNGPDPVNVACRSNGAVVRWGPGDAIGEIRTKDGSLGDLHNCGRAGGDYQCVVQGNVDDEVMYDVVAANGCVLDPVIRIR